MSLGLLAPYTVLVNEIEVFSPLVLGQVFFPTTLKQSVLQSLTESRN